CQHLVLHRPSTSSERAERPLPVCPRGRGPSRWSSLPAGRDATAPVLDDCPVLSSGASEGDEHDDEATHHHGPVRDENDHRPIRRVSERLAALDGYRRWMRRTGLFRRAWQTSDSPLGQGTAYYDATRMGTFRGEVTSYEPPASISFRETLRWFGHDLMEARP